MPRAAKKAATASGVGIVYARYSSHNQKDASIEQQVEKARAYAAEIGIPISEVYADRAISGKTDRRPNFQRMMRDAEQRKFSFVIAWKSNRMGRNMLQAMVNEARLNDLGIRCLYVEEDFDDSAAGRFALRSMMNVNQFYSENMAEDIRRGMMDNAANCKVTNGHIPFGYKKTPDLHYALDEPRAAVVREIFRRVARGEQYADIARDLNDRGLRTSYGKPFGRTSLQKIIHNERYRGIYIYDTVRIENGIPRIVDDDLYFRVQEAVKMKKNPEGAVRNYGDYLLTGRIFCGHCKRPMIGVSGTSKNRSVHNHYKCQGRHSHSGCKKKNVRRDDVEFAVAKYLYEYALRDDVVEWIADWTVEHFRRKAESSDLPLMQEELATTDKALQNIMAAIEKGIFNDTTQTRMVELEGEREILKSRIAAAQAEIITVPRETIVKGLQKMKGGDIENKEFQRKLFDMFLKAVYIYDDTMKLVFRFSFEGKDSTTVPITDDLIDSVESMADCSYEVHLGPPRKIPPYGGIFLGSAASRRDRLKIAERGIPSSPHA